MPENRENKKEEKREAYKNQPFSFVKGGKHTDDGEIESHLEVEANMISLRKKKEIEKSLANFEDKAHFLRSSISLAKLATYCKTNIKYLSYYINKYKGVNFNHYINELRVNYLLEKLKEDPMLRRSKMSKLAKIGGFSSQNKFSTIFKEFTDMTPSAYIKKLNKEEEQGND
ncbi:AraC family transcriptional regulator [Weeksellaceae bacterium KMM 9713]|uniref:AraC family transcriptional regulator n=1 Tax=Profundicola chukchiensis TaxID=2961959 RepID=A0A9X4RVD2_9FLAO|nr:AraC family transcriptional regulator [Profundicola chukchiensis]MDG4947053.1 AraC family transcriptional regulator [Profundicola chukchiensis]